MDGGVTKGAIPVKLGERTFKNKAAAKQGQAVQDVLHAAVPDEIITDPDIIELCFAIARFSGRWSCESYPLGVGGLGTGGLAKSQWRPPIEAISILNFS